MTSAPGTPDAAPGAPAPAAPLPTTATGPAACPSCGTPAVAGARFCEQCGADLPLAPPTGAGAGGTPAARDEPPGAPGPEGPPAPPAPPVPPVPAPPPAPSEASTPTVHVHPRGAGRRRGPGGAPGETATVPACLECGGVVDADGYCTQCGTKAPRPRDHMEEQPQPWVASVSDRGVRHHRNEDAAATAADPEPGSWAAIVVCDGVSSSESSDVASLAAVRAARDVLVRSRGAGLASGSALTALAASRLVAAGAAAAAAVAATTEAHHGESPPSCTFTAALLDGDRLAVGNVGDSRAYWVPDAGEPRALTVDDSWAAEEVADGVPRAEAEAGPQAHAITRWLGVDSHDQVPTVTHHTVDGPGWLLLCSDGLWNYCSEARSAARVLADAAATHGEPLATAREMVRWANEQGGRDNITVALARIGRPPARTHEGEPA